MIEAISDAIENAGAQLLFALLLIALYVWLLVALLFAALVFRTVWRWLTWNTWSTMIVHAERKALR